MLSRGFAVLVFVSLLLLQGCVAVQSFPTVARSGDTITLAVGSVEGMTKANTSLTYTPDSTVTLSNPDGVPILLPASSLRAIVPLYPDKRTLAWNASAATSIDGLTGHGSWLTVLVIDLPALPKGPELPEGTGVIKVQTAATYSTYSANVNTEDISLEIIPGVGAPTTFSYKGFAGANPQPGLLSNVEVLPHYLIKPDFVPTPIFSTPPWPEYGAIEIKVTGALSSSDEVAINSQMRVMLDDMEQNILSHTHMDWVRDGDTTTINIVSSKGLLNYYQARVSLFFTGSNITYSSPPIITAKYFDVNGLEVAGPVVKATYVTN